MCVGHKAPTTRRIKAPNMQITTTNAENSILAPSSVSWVKGGTDRGVGVNAVVGETRSVPAVVVSIVSRIVHLDASEN